MGRVPSIVAVGVALSLTGCTGGGAGSTGSSTGGDTTGGDATGGATSPVVSDTAFPNGIWATDGQLFFTRLPENPDESGSLPNEGGMVITPTEIVEYYRYGSLACFEKYQSDWASGRMYTEFVGDDWSVTLDQAAEADLSATFYNELGEIDTNGNFNLVSEYSAASEWELDQKYSPLCPESIPAELPVAAETFPNGIWRSYARDLLPPARNPYDGREHGGGMMITDTTLRLFESHLSDGGTSPDACSHGGDDDLSWSVWPSSIVGYSHIDLSFSGSYESGKLVRHTTSSAISTDEDPDAGDDDVIYYEYVGPVTANSAAMFYAEYSLECAEDDH